MVRFTAACSFLLNASLLFSGTASAWIPSSLRHRQSSSTLQPFSTSLLQPTTTTSRQKQPHRNPSLLYGTKDTEAPNNSGGSSTSTKPRELILFNSKTRRKDVFQPVYLSAKSSSKVESADDAVVTMYTCGPTVYDYAHVGNFRAFLTYDLLKRVLTYLGYRVVHVCNLTDVDDKIINRANELQLPDVTELTRKYEDLFMKDLQALNIVPATHYPRATEHVREMLQMIIELNAAGLAYETADGSWYFRTQQQPGYGQQLVQLNYEEMMQQDGDDDDAAADAAASIEKEHFADFCLWKAFKEGVDRDDAAWSSADFADFDASSVKITRGRPGWHMECSAMARKFFGDETIDLHGGGIDLKFPHHENEIAQSEGVSCTTFCNCWFHNGFVNLDNEKMSKSLGNFLTLRTACPTPRQVRAYRYLVVSSQYRNPLAFTPDCMKAAQSAITRMDKVRADLEKALLSPQEDGDSDNSEIASTVVPKALNNFEAAIVDDLSMPRAAASLFTLVKAAEQEFKRVAKQNKKLKKKNGSGDDNESATKATLDLVGLQAIQSALEQMDQVFGIFYDVPVSEEEAMEQAAKEQQALTIPGEIKELVSQRTAAKQAKDWELADSLRKRITELGFAVKDVKGGEPIVSRVES